MILATPLGPGSWPDPDHGRYVEVDALYQVQLGGVEQIGPCALEAAAELLESARLVRERRERVKGAKRAK